MGYVVELSFQLCLSCILEPQVLKYMNEHNVTSWDASEEYEGDKLHGSTRNHRVLFITFDKSASLMKFVKKMKQMRKVHVECVYTNYNPVKILYTSSYYRENKMGKYSKKRQRSNSDEEELVMKNLNLIS